MPEIYHKQFWVGRHYRGALKRYDKLGQSYQPDELEKLCYSKHGIQAELAKRRGVRL